MSLEDHWESLWKRAGGNGTGYHKFAYRRLEERYKEPHRHFHTLDFVSCCLRELDPDVGTATAPDENAVKMAIWFSKAVWEPSVPDDAGVDVNERRSADLARNVLDIGEFPEPFIEKVAGLVVSAGLVAAHDDDARTFADVMYAHYGWPEAQFDEYERSYRREHAAMPDAEYAELRADALRAEFGRTRIYETRTMYDKYEFRARANILRLIDRYAKDASPA